METPTATQWTEAQLNEARHWCALNMADSDEAGPLYHKLQAELGTAIRDALCNFVEDEAILKAEKHDQLKADLGDELFRFYELLVGRRELTVWDLCSSSGLSQPSVWRRLKTLEQRGLVKELPPVQARWTVT